MRLLLLLFLISNYAFTQQKDTLYVVYSKEKYRKDNYKNYLSKRFWRDFLYRKNVWVFSSGFSDLVYDTKKHQKKELNREDFFNICIRNKSRVMYNNIAYTFINTSGDTIDIDNRIFIETEDESREMVYPKPKKPVLNEKGEEQVNFDPPPFYYHYIRSFKAYVVEITKEGQYFLYEVDWIYGMPTL